MKTTTLLLAALLVSGAALAQDPYNAQPPAKEPASQMGTENKPMATATKELTVQVVSTDPVAKTITVRKEGDVARTEPPTASNETTLPVESQALSALKTVTAGEKVKITCRTNSAGTETAVTAIKKSSSSSEKPKSDRPESN